MTSCPPPHCAALSSCPSFSFGCAPSAVAEIENVTSSATANDAARRFIGLPSHVTPVLYRVVSIPQGDASTHRFPTSRSCSYLPACRLFYKLMLLPRENRMCSRHVSTLLNQPTLDVPLGGHFLC